MQWRQINAAHFRTTLVQEDTQIGQSSSIFLLSDAQDQGGVGGWPPACSRTAATWIAFIVTAAYFRLIRGQSTVLPDMQQSPLALPWD